MAHSTNQRSTSWAFRLWKSCKWRPTEQTLPSPSSRKNYICDLARRIFVILTLAHCKGHCTRSFTCKLTWDVISMPSKIQSQKFIDTRHPPCPLYNSPRRARRPIIILACWKFCGHLECLTVREIWDDARWRWRVRPLDTWSWWRCSSSFRASLSTEISKCIERC